MPRGLRAIPCLLVAALMFWLGPEPTALRSGLALFVLIGGLWMTQALPLAATALLVPVLAILGGLAAPRAALAPFAHPIIFLFLGGFALAAALQAQGLDRALARVVMRASGGSRARAVLLLCASGAALSMWISNTATAAMLLPLALGLLQVEPGDTDTGGAAPSNEHGFVLLALAYSCSIGGMGTIVGSPPNAIAAAQADISFLQWLEFGIPAVILMWPTMLGLLWWLLRPRFDGGVVQDDERMPWTPARLRTVVIFALAVAGWIGGAPLARWLGITTDTDTLVALLALIALMATGCLSWRELETRTQWGVLLLFGGGLALSQLMQSTGTSHFLAQGALSLLHGAHPLLILAGAALFVIFLTELVSNTASTALLLPIFLPAAEVLGAPPPAIAAGVAIAASCAFMLPVATPPNAIVYGTGRIPQSWMMRCGLWLNLASAMIVTALIATLAA